MKPSEPRLDPFATAYAGRPLEDLSRIPALQPFRSDGPTVPYRAVETLARASRGTLAGAEASLLAALVDAELAADDGTLTENGRLVAGGWAESRAQLVVNAFTLGARTGLEARIAAGHCVLAAGPSAAELIAGQVPDPGPVRVQIASLTALPLLVASWVGLAPAWQFAVSPDRLPAALVDARVADPAVPCPAEADENLRQMWAQPWVDWRVQTTPNGNTVGYLAAGERGQFLTWVEGDRRVLSARPPMHVWRDLIRLVEVALREPA
jgi:hypothetical protein